MFGPHEGFDLANDVRARGGDILLFDGIGFDVVEFERSFGAKPVAFPIAHPHRLLDIGLVDFEIERLALRLLTSPDQGGQDRIAIETRWRGRPGQIRHRRRKSTKLVNRSLTVPG